MSNNFNKTAVLKKDIFANKFWGPLLCLNFSGCYLDFPCVFVCNFYREIFTDKCIENFKKWF